MYSFPDVMKQARQAKDDKRIFHNKSTIVRINRGGFILHNEQLHEMTVVQLRKLARDNGVKLKAGIDKDGIIERLDQAMTSGSKIMDGSESSAFGQEAGQVEKSVAENERVAQISGEEEKLQEAPLAADVTSVAPKTGYQPAWQASHSAGSEAAVQSVYKPAWQARTSVPRQPLRQPNWQTPRPAGTASRFGPQVSQPQNATMGMSAAQQSMDSATGDSAPRLDGYRLGYQAAPQRNHNQRQEGYRPSYRQEPRQQHAYQQPLRPSTEDHFNDSLYKPMRDVAFSEPYDGSQPLPDWFSATQPQEASGVLEILPDGYGFLRANSLLPGKDDIYVSIAQIRRFGLRTGDQVEGKARPQRDSDKFSALLYVEKLNGQIPEEDQSRVHFESLTPVYPNQRVKLEGEKSQDNMTIRLVDLVAPIGFGQRAMIIAPPDSGRLSILREMGRAIKQNDPEAHVMMLLVDTAPEEVTEIRDAIDVEVFASTFTESPESQTRASETMLETAQRLVEDGKNVVILLDSLTKLTRAYQAALTQGGRAMTNSVTPAALVKPKRFFGMARNTREAGSLTIIATIVVETGSRVDDIIFEEFKGTANLEVRLCPPEYGDPIFPLIDLARSGTKKDDILLSNTEKESLRTIRKVLGATTNREAVIQLVDMMQKTKSNEDLFNRMKDWLAMWEKSGFLSRR